MKTPKRPPKQKSFAAMLAAAVEAPHDAERNKMRAVADRLVELAIEGDMRAIKEIVDRLGGKAGQGDDDGAIRVFTEVRRTIVDPRSSNG